MGYDRLKGKDSILQEGGGIKAIPPNYVLSVTDTTFTEESGKTYKIPPADLSQYTTSKTILNSTQSLKPEEHTTSTLETATHGTQLDIYKPTIEAQKDPISLLDIINYLGNLDEDAKEIYALKLAEEIYKNESLPDKEITEICTYLNLLEGFGLIKPREFKKVYDDSTTEIMQHTYQIEPEMQELLKDTYRDALSTGTDELPVPEANEALTHYLENKTDEKERDTWKAYL